MSEINRRTSLGASTPTATHEYPLDHWQELGRFLEGEERDPKDLFFLADDIWYAWPYARAGRPTESHRHSFHFGHLRSFLKPYVKWHCYEQLIGSGKSLTSNRASLPYCLTCADNYLCAHDLNALENLASPACFADLWESLLIPYDASRGPRPHSAVMRQLSTRRFWEHLRERFGAPLIIPPPAPHVMRTPVESASDEQQVVPDPVIRQLVNRLALHRDGKALLTPKDHLRLCVLVLVFCVGRRLDEVLGAPRGQGPNGPLHTYPAKGSPGEEALWFQFNPNKNGPRDLAYISPRWSEIAHYCVQSLCKYSDEVRMYAPLAEQNLLILVATWNGTASPWHRSLGASQQVESDGGDASSGTPDQQSNCEPRHASALSQARFQRWLHGEFRQQPDKGGILHRWGITTNGTLDGPIYYLRPHQARHTRQSALAKDPRISLLARQRDLNHRHRDVQFAYQHTLRDQNHMLLEKARQGLLIGPALGFLQDVLDVEYQEQRRENPVSSGWHPGSPIVLNEHWRTLIARSPHFLQFNRVDCGY